MSVFRFYATPHFDLELYKNWQTELTIEGNSVFWGIPVIIPAKLQGLVLHKLNSSHFRMTKMKSLA